MTRYSVVTPRKKVYQVCISETDAAALVARSLQALFCRRRHQPRRPALANIRPGNPAPAIGPGTGLTTMLSILTEAPWKSEKTNLSLAKGSAMARSEKGLTTVSNPNEPGGRPGTTPNTQQNGDTALSIWNSKFTFPLLAAKSTERKLNGTPSLAVTSRAVIPGAGVPSKLGAGLPNCWS
jgi:hypothetical protein